MAYPFNKIYLMWRLGIGSRRIIIGELSDFKNGNLKFSYIEDGVNEAIEISDKNFKGYPGLDLSKPSFDPELIKSLFFSRLVSTKRQDAKELLSFWLVEGNRISDQLYILAKTQGLLPTDNFEFVANYYSNQRCPFVTDIAGLSASDFDLATLEEGNYLSFELEQGNEYDKNAVAVYYKENKIGYIKQGHNIAFKRKDKSKVTIRVHKIIITPKIKKLYVRIDFMK